MTDGKPVIAWPRMWYISRSVGRIAGGTLVQHDDNTSGKADGALARATDALLQSIAAEPVPPAIRDLALRLQAAIDAQQEGGAAEPVARRANGR
jgi:hypothetical protein